MISPIKHLAINWMDGMKLSSDHFIAADLHHLDRLRDVISLSINPYNYGLLPPFAGQTSSLDLQITERSTSQVEITLIQCNGITLGGDRIDFFGRQPDEGLRLNVDVSNNMTAEFTVLLSCNSFDRVPIGLPDAEEEPLRFPNIRKNYRLMLVPLAELAAYCAVGNCLSLAKLQIISGVLTIHNDFIPPSCCLNSHHALIRYRQMFEEQLTQLQEASVKLVSKTRGSDVSEIGRNIGLVSKRLLDYISSTYFNFRHKLQWEPPINLIGYVSSLAHHFYTALKLIPTKEREVLLRYFYEWRDITPADFDMLLAKIIGVDYVHDDCLPSFETATVFLQAIVTLWTKLTTLEFLGQHKENIVIAEQRVTTSRSNKTTWSLLD